MVPLLLGLTGRPFAGKDATAQVLAAHGFVSIAFADALRAELAWAWNVDQRLFATRTTKEQPTDALAIQLCSDAGFLRLAAARGWDPAEPRSPRWAMQYWGTEYRRSQRSDYWVMRVEHWIHAQRLAGHRRIVITDVRFPDEAAMLRDLAGWLVRVHRPDLVALECDARAHVSEGHTALQADADIHNDGDLGHLANEAARVISALSDVEVALFTMSPAAAGCSTLHTHLLN
jgi:hypothetical protein